MKLNQKLQVVLLQTCIYHDMTVVEIFSKSRELHIAQARHQWRYLAHDIVKAKDADIIRFEALYNNTPNHSTIINSKKKVRNQYDTNRSYRYDLNELIINIKNNLEGPALNKLKKLPPQSMHQMHAQLLN